MEKETYERNREAWNEATEYHQKARNKSLHEGFKNESAKPYFWMSPHARRSEDATPSVVEL